MTCSVNGAQLFGTKAEAIASCGLVWRAGMGKDTRVAKLVRAKRARK